MSDYMSQITPDMTRTVDKLKATNFENATPEEIEIYAKFNTLLNMHSEEVRQKAKLREAESAQRMESYRMQAESAMNALETLNQVAHEKLKAVQNGQ